MIKRIAIAVLLLTSTLAVAEDKVFKLEYTVVEMDAGKKVSSRSYTMMVEDRQRGSMRVGSRVPVPTGSFKDGPSQYNYMDVGVNLDAKADSIDAANVRLNTTIDINSVVAVGENAPARPPVIRSCKDSVSTIVPLDKVTTLVTQDDPTGTSSLSVQVTVKLVK